MVWTELCKVTVSAKPKGTWTWAYDYVQGPGLIKIEVDAKEPSRWYYSPGRDCTADGDLNATIACRNCILPDAPVGALIAKIGGSTAGVKDGKLFLAGRTAVITIDQSMSGPLLLTINDELTGLSDNSGDLNVTISITLPPATSQSSAGSGSATSSQLTSSGSTGSSLPGSRS